MPNPVFLERLVANLPGMAYRCRHDADWTLEFASEGSTELLGYTPDQLVERREVAVSDLIHPDDLAGVSLEVERALAEKRAFRCLYRMRTASSEEKWISELGRGEFSEDGALVALEGFLGDVTAQVRAEETLRQSQRREVIGRLASGVAHDLNNLLMGLRGTLAALRDDAAMSPSMAEELGVLEELSERIAALTRQLLHLGSPRSSSGAPLDLSSSLQDMASTLERLAGRAIDLSFETPSAPALARLDLARFEQVVANLVVNARDAVDEGGRIVTRVDADEEGVQLVVEDDGCGMPAEVRDRIFDPFFTTKAAERGTGLGLAVVHDIVAAAGGSIAVESSPGTGTRVAVTLPTGDDALPGGLAARGDLGTEVILLVDDDPLVLRTIARGLRRLGYTVLEAENGARALDLSDRHKGPIHVLVTDAKMPVMGGIALAERFKETREDSARILMSGDNVTPEAGLFSARLQKPFDASQLARELRGLLDAEARQDSAHDRD